jgi:hypothetical protein
LFAVIGMNSVSLIALNHDVHEANGYVPEQHGERGHAELEAQGLRIGKEPEAYEKRRDGDQPGDGEFLEEAEKDQHEPPDSLEEVSDGGGHDLAEVCPRVGRLVLDT